MLLIVPMLVACAGPESPSSEEEELLVVRGVVDAVERGNGPYTLTSLVEVEVLLGTTARPR